MTIATYILILAGLYLLFTAFYQLIIKDRGKDSPRKELGGEGDRRIVDVLVRSFVTKEGHVIWSPPQVRPAERAQPQLALQVETDMVKRHMIMPSVIREQSEALVSVTRDEIFLRAICKERFRVLNRGMEPGAYFISNEKYFNAAVPAPSIIGYSAKSGDSPFNWGCTRIKIIREGQKPLEFQPTDKDMIDNLWHAKDYWGFDYPVLLEPAQSANIEIDMLAWVAIEELDISNNMMWIPVLSLYRNFIPKGQFVYDVVEEPQTSVRIQRVFSEPILEDTKTEENESPDGLRHWRLVFPRIIMWQLMGIKMLLRLT